MAFEKNEYMNFSTFPFRNKSWNCKNSRTAADTFKFCCLRVVWLRLVSLYNKDIKDVTSFNYSHDVIEGRGRRVLVYHVVHNKLTLHFSKT